MDALRLSRWTARWMLGWFVTFLLAAGFAPWVNAAPADAVCTVAAGDSGGDPAGSQGTAHGVHVLKCGLCTGIAAPPAALPSLPSFAVPAVAAECSFAPAPVETLAWAPLPARGPPRS